MAQTPLNLDTSPDIERRQVESWRRMSAAQKATMVTALHRYPAASPRAHFLRVASIVLGPDLARLAYPDAAEVISQ